MTEPATPEAWTRRDLPVLRQILAELDHPDAFRVSSARIAETLGLTEQDVRLAFKNLERGGYVEFPPSSSRRASFDGDEIQDFTGKALTATGAWPTPETGLERMVAALEAIANNTAEDDDTRSRARKLLDGLTGAGRQIGMAMAVAYATGHLPS